MTSSSSSLSGIFNLSWKWDVEAKKLLRHLIEGVADPVLNQPEPDTPSGVIDSRIARRILIEKGKEQLQYDAMGLFDVLDQLDPRDRERAYRSLYALMDGIYDVAAQAIYPTDVFQMSDASQAAMARKAFQTKNMPRDEIIREVAEGRSGHSSAAIKEAVNARIEAAGYGPLSAKQIGRVIKGHS